MRKAAVLVLLLAAALSMSGAPAKKTAPSVAPDSVPHSIALYLASLSNEGARTVTFKARAFGLRYFFEEPGKGVTVYRFNSGQYVKEEFLRGFTLDRAIKRYLKK